MYQDQDQNRTRPYATPTARVLLHNIRHGQGRLVTFAVAAATLALVVAAAVLTMFFLNKNSTAAQILQLQQTVASEQAALTQAQSSNANGYNSLNGKIASIDSALNILAQFNQTCSTDLTGPNGPAQFFFLCSPKQPG